MGLVLKKFGAAWCPPCQAMKKNRTLEKFSDEHPDVRIEVHDDTETGSARFQKTADDWNVKNLPTIVWLNGREELFRSNEVSMTALEQQYKRAVKAAQR